MFSEKKHVFTKKIDQMFFFINKVKNVGHGFDIWFLNILIDFFFFFQVIWYFFVIWFTLVFLTIFPININEQCNTGVLPLLHFTRLDCSCQRLARLLVYRLSRWQNSGMVQLTVQKFKYLTEAPGVVYGLLLMPGGWEETWNPDLSLKIS